MKLLRILLLAALGLFFAVSCSDSESTATGDPVTISGQIRDGANKSIGLYKISLKGQKSLVMSTQADVRGNFSMKSDKPLSEAIYQYMVGNQGVSFYLSGEVNVIQTKGNLNALTQS